MDARSRVRNVRIENGEAKARADVTRQRVDSSRKDTLMKAVVVSASGF
jgi:hypothetical protein